MPNCSSPSNSPRSGQAETLVRQASVVDRAWLPPTQIVDDDRNGVRRAARESRWRVRRTKFVDLVLDEAPAALPRDVDPGPMLAAAVAERFDPATLVDDDARRYSGAGSMPAQWMPSLELPDFGPEPWRDLLARVVRGQSERRRACAAHRRSRAIAVAADAATTARPSNAKRPERIEVPSGSRIVLEYEVGKPPVLAVRIQELFGLAETPRVAGGRIAVLLHLLAPNYRVQQITPDLASFWKNTYPEVKKELKRRYPKHAWPDDPLTAQAEHRPQRRK